jgi:hypothetical protein
MNQIELKKKADPILGFLVRKGFLLTNIETTYSGQKLNVLDVITVAEEVEPRVYEVLPAALIHFPATFLHREQLPPELASIITAIKKGLNSYQDYKWVKYKDMKRWADRSISDKRVKKISEKRVSRTYRLTPNIIKKIKSQATKLQITETEYVEQLVRVSAI